MALEQELDFFESQKQEWLKHYRGQYALIKGTTLLGTFTSFEQAFEAGVKQLGNQAFLVKQVTEEDETIQYPALLVGMIDARS